MKFPFYIARRYLFSKKSTNAVNIITWVSILGIGIGTAAIILVLSVFNGLTGFIEELFSALDPDLKIVAVEGQTFSDSTALYDAIAADPDVAVLTRTLEGQVGFQFTDDYQRDNQAFGVLKGVESNFTEINPIDSFLYGGTYSLAPRQDIYRGIFGGGIFTELNADLATDLQDPNPVQVLYLPASASLRNAQAGMKMDFLYPSAYFSVQKEYDEKYVLADLNFVQELFELPDRVSAYEIGLVDSKEAETVKARLQALVGDKLTVQTWFDQHLTLYRVMKNEKYVSYLILVLMLAIAAVNIVGSLSMIVIEKTRDIAILKTMGTRAPQIRRIFLLDGMLVGGLGGLIGVVLAFTLGLAQQKYGLVALQGGFRVEAFPVSLELSDFVLVFFTVLVLATLASIYPSRQAARVEVVTGIHS